ncbi:hypothetical protein CASFOL_007017 [Castilleja foliolosa]|uniref:Uncharacterized protein n=1 Tax=Castilleja foliolosa TaxID=1961234 RepID=A0ABD3EC57_9LAMI
MAPTSSNKLLMNDLNPKLRPKPCLNTAPPNSTSSSSSTAASPLPEKKNRDQPNFSDCHCCGGRINNTNPKDRLQPLDSVWCIVLLCRGFRRNVRSGQTCPYCFRGTGDSGDFLICSVCERKIHRDCVRNYGNCTPWCYLGVGSEGFRVCVDCWVPELLKNSIRVSGMSENKGGLTENVGKSKAMVEMDSPNAENLNCGDSTEVVDDVELAIQLHRAMNSSPRITRIKPLLKTPSDSDISNIRDWCSEVRFVVCASDYPVACNRRLLDLPSDPPKLRRMSSVHSPSRLAISVPNLVVIWNVAKRVEDVVPIVTGHEREELEAEIQGKDLLEINYPSGPFGTKSAPAIRYCFRRLLFACGIFCGNPAAVCLLEEEGDDEWLQSVAREFNLSQTAYLTHLPESTQSTIGSVPRFALRWFTPVAEVKLCGHATLAASHILFTHGLVKSNTIEFLTLSGVLTVVPVMEYNGASEGTLDYIEIENRTSGNNVHTNAPKDAAAKDDSEPTTKRQKRE